MRALRVKGGRMRLLPIQIALFGTIMAAGYIAGQLWSTDDAIKEDSVASSIPRRRLLGEFPRDLVLNVPEGSFESDEDYDKADNKHMLVLHALGIVYMFAGLAIVCDDYFVSALEEISERFQLSEDVAGATFMAAGGSAPELFTATLGVFVAESDVGFGTIVGSAVFNVLFVIGLCAVFAKERLKLTWWPLFRDCTYYSFGLLVLTYVVIDKEVHWYEAAMLLVCYVGYVTIMKFNTRLQAFTERMIAKCKRQKPKDCGGVLSVKPAAPRRKSKAADGSGDVSEASDEVEDDPMEGSLDSTALSKQPDLFVKRGSQSSEQSASRASIPKVPTNKVVPSGLPPRPAGNGVSTPMAERPADLQYTHHHALESTNAQVAFREFRSIAMRSFRNGEVAKLERSLSANKDVDNPEKKLKVVRSVPTGLALAARAQRVEELNSPQSARLSPAVHPLDTAPPTKSVPLVAPPEVPKASTSATDAAEEKAPESSTEAEEEEDDDEGLFDIPSSAGGRVAWVLLFPLKFCMAITIPDCSTPKWKNWYALTFTMSVLWIAGFAYCMVWWSSTMGFTLGIPDAIMGLTILAAGTSIPDALSSVIVARNGYGDMAVSSSIGSNVFDINMGLPLPWLLKTVIVDPGSTVSIESCGLPILVITLLLMVVVVVLSIRFTGWVLDMKLGWIMFILYVVFLVQSLLMEYSVIDVSC